MYWMYKGPSPPTAGANEETPPAAGPEVDVLQPHGESDVAERDGRGLVARANRAGRSHTRQ